MPAIARIGDPISHGGSITGGSTTVTAGGAGVARVGDTVVCSTHGPQTITQGSSRVTADGQGVAYDGALVSCGATVIATLTTVEVAP